MKANELRIGNYVNIEGDVVKVKEIYEKGIHYTYGEYESYATEDFIQPIELTEELLVKLGFEGEMYEICLHTDDFNIAVNLIEIRVDIAYYGNCEAELCIKYNVKYLHELQNLCYCITGQELNIEL
jgi:hypothetical protein